MASLDSPPDLFPFADLFLSMLVLQRPFSIAFRVSFEIHFLFQFRLHYHDGSEVVAALGRGEIRFNMLFEFRLILIFSSTFGCASILVLS